MNLDFNQIQSHFDGKAGLIAGLYQEISMDMLESVEIETTKKDPSTYRVYESTCIYHDIDLKMITCYSEQLGPQKERTLEKSVFKEYTSLADYEIALIYFKNKNDEFSFMKTRLQYFAFIN